jgi:NAD(P)-dependent dehydrogenase (short-subunit alcohol dehydrogenase family)
LKRDLRGAVAIVTGASSGIGWQSAVRLAEAGVKLCVTARRAEALDELCRKVEASGGSCIAVPGDVSVDADVARVVERCLEHYGRIDLLVNDAAVQVYAHFEDYEWAEIERVFQVTCFGYFRFARAVLPHFRRQGSGHIINVLSMLSLGGAPLLSVYSAAKHALYGWQESFRLELRGTGIDVSGVMLPSVATPMFDHAPMKLGRAPKPIPPTYDPDVGARAVVECARKPNPRAVPVFLQGRLILWLQNWVPAIGEAILSRWGARLQMRKQLVDPRRGNLFAPIAEGVGPRGSVAPTPRWLLWLAGAGVLGVGVGTLFAAAVGGRRVARALRGSGARHHE